MNSKYAFTLPINGIVKFKLTDRGLQYLKDWGEKNQKKETPFNNFLYDGKTYKSSLSDLLAVFGPTLFVGAFNVIESNAVIFDDMTFNLNDRITFKLNKEGKEYLEKFLKEEQNKYHLKDKRVIKIDDDGKNFMTLHDFAHTFSNKLKLNENIIEENSLLKIEYQ